MVVIGDTEPQDLRRASTKTQHITRCRIAMPDTGDSLDALRQFGTEYETGNMKARWLHADSTIQEMRRNVRLLQ